MVTKDNIIEILLQIGFYEADEFEITFNGIEEKFAWKIGDMRVFIYNEYRVVINHKINEFELMCYPVDNSSLFFLTIFSLDISGKEILRTLKKEFKHEMRKLIIKKIIQ